MSLKAFHLLFIVASILLGAGLGGWSLRQYLDLNEGWLLALTVGSWASTLGLMAYLPWFLKKARPFGYLGLAALLSLGSETAHACAVCFGNPNSPMVKSTNAGVTFLLGVVAVVLMGFLGLFIFWWVRAARIAREESRSQSLAA